MQGIFAVEGLHESFDGHPLECGDVGFVPGLLQHLAFGLFLDHREPFGLLSRGLTRLEVKLVLWIRL